MRTKVTIHDSRGNRWSKWIDECELSSEEIRQLENGERLEIGGLTFEVKRSK